MEQRFLHMSGFPRSRSNLTTGLHRGSKVGRFCGTLVASLGGKGMISMPGLDKPRKPRSSVFQMECRGLLRGLGRLDPIPEVL